MSNYIIHNLRYLIVHASISDKPIPVMYISSWRNWKFLCIYIFSACDCYQYIYGKTSQFVSYSTLLRCHKWRYIIMTSSNRNIFRITGHLWGEFNGPRWIPRTKASDAELLCFLWSTGDLRRYQAHHDVTLMYKCLVAIVRCAVCVCIIPDTSNCKTWASTVATRTWYIREAYDRGKIQRTLLINCLKTAFNLWISVKHPRIIRQPLIKRSMNIPYVVQFLVIYV